MLIKHIDRSVEDFTLINEYHRLLAKDNLTEASNLEVDISNIGDFYLNVVVRTHFYIIFDKDQMMAHFFLNNFEGKTAQLHFGVLKSHHRASRELGLRALSYIDDAYDLTALFGYTPANNRAAFNLSKKLGFEHLVTVPEMIFDIHSQKHVDAEVTIRRTP